MRISAELAEIACENDNGKNNDNMEEGEIIENDFEDIISSDEELSMRKRIEELEARNLELEKIANISGIYSCDFSKKDLGYPSERYKNGSLALDLSDSEDYGTKKTYTSKRIKSASSKAAATAAATRRNRYKDLSPVLYKAIRKRSQSPDYNGRSSLRDYSKTRKRKHEKIKNRIPRKLRDRSKKRLRLDYTSSEEEFCSLDRDELRMALRHDLKVTNPQGNLRNLIKDTTRTLDERKDEGTVTIEVKDDSEKDGNSSDDSVSLEEQELRLIALKSAIVKKHMARKKRKEIDEKKPYSPTDFLQPIGNAENDTTSPKLFLDHDACNSMDISPIPSPDNLNEDYTDKSVDMDLVDSSNSSSPIFVGQQKWTPINEIPLPSDRKYETENHVSSQFQKIISPMPIRLQQSGMPSIKPSRHVINIDEDDEMIEIQSNEASSPEPIDEEANALRALLLAQKNSPKFNKDKDLKGVAKKPEPHLPENAENIPEKMLGILSIVEGPAHKTAVILKEAVKRLRKKSPDTQCHNRLSSDQSEVTNHPLSNICRLQSPEKKILEPIIVEQPPTVKTPPIGFNTNVKCSGIKENISIRQKSRPNNIQIIPTVVIPRNSRKSPLTEIVETDNVKPKSVEIITKPQVPVIIDPPKTTPIRQTIPTLKALQLKTLNLISAGKLLNTNKTIATKLLNKAIHQNVIQTKRKSLSLQNTTIKRTKPATSSRLITNFDIPTVKKLVIRVHGTSETESDDCLNDDATASLVNNFKIPPDDEYDIASPMSLPMQSPRDSPLTIAPSAIHPTTNKAVVVAAAIDVSRNSVGGGSSVVVVTSDPLPTDNFTAPKKSNDTFQAQLDEFLKNARSKVDLIKKETATSTTTTKILTASSPVPPRTNATPLAVRHLPPSSQLEYRRLVNRMQTLEKQKQARSKIIMPAVDKSFKVTIRNDIAALKPQASNRNEQLLEKLKCSEEKSIGQIAKFNETKRVIRNEISLAPEIPKEPVKLDAVIKPKVIAKLPQSVPDSKHVIATTTNKLIKKDDSKNNAARPASTQKTESKPNSTLEIDSTKLHIQAETKKKSVPKEKPKKKIVPPKRKPRNLSECEKDYQETSSSLVQNIAKTIDLVVSAKEEKHAKFMLENELEELHEKMITIEYKINLKKLKISKIYPEISSSHKTIMELKSRTSQLEKYSENMGNNLKAGKNNLYTDQKHKIMELSKKLSAEIKNLKNFKISDFKKEKLMEREKENSTLKCEMFDRSVQVDLLCLEMNDGIDDKSQENNTNNNKNSIKNDDGNNGGESSFSLSECDTQNVQNSLELIDSEKMVEDNLGQTEQNSVASVHGDECMQDIVKNGNDEKNVIPDRKSLDVARNESEAMDDLEQKVSDEENVLSVTKYISPLNYSNNEEHINPHGVICPYQLMGQCDDKECKFEHLNNST